MSYYLVECDFTYSAVLKARSMHWFYYPLQLFWYSQRNLYAAQVLHQSPQDELIFDAGSLLKRDTAFSPSSGHLDLALRTDCSDACHIGWHPEQGFALQFIEREDDIHHPMKKRGITNHRRDMRELGCLG